MPPPLIKAVAKSRPHLPDVGNDVFLRKPLTVGDFRLSGKEAKPIGKPTLAGWTSALEFAAGAYDESPYWIGSLMQYAEGREDWTEKLSQAMSVTGLARHTLENLASIYRRTTPTVRRLAPSPGHAEAVAALPEEAQVQLLGKARAEEMSVRDLRLEVRAVKRARVIEGQAVLEGQYRVIIADCPWIYGNRPPSGKGAKEHYQGMTIEQLSKLPVAAHATPNAVLFAWVTAPMLYEQPGPNDVFRAWGFTPKTGMVWHKGRHNFGNYVAVKHEHVVICTRGSCTPDRPTPMIDSVFTSAKDYRELEHSEKPEELRHHVERLYNGPYLELFGRRPVEGWTVFGNDARLWSCHAESA